LFNLKNYLNEINPAPPSGVHVLELNLKAKPTDIPEWMNKYVIKKQLVGSRAICVPAPVDTDIDFLCLVMEEDVETVQDLLLKDDYESGGSKDKHNSFHSYKKGEINIILTHKEIFYVNFVTAMLVCKELNVLDKKKRIKVHHLIIGE
jgi:hypothetical protein